MTHSLRSVTLLNLRLPRPEAALCVAQALALGSDIDRSAFAFIGAQNQHGFAIKQRDVVSYELGGEMMIAIG